MATPVVNHILPYGSEVGDDAEGPTMGRSLVEIYGRNFRLPPVPDPGPSGDIVNGLVVADEQETVSVTFGGVEAVSVGVASHICLRVITPISPLAGTAAGDYGDGAVDVVVTNLDDNGDAIPGESVTVSGGYTYRHVKLDATATSDLERLIYRLMEEMKKQILPEVVLTAHTDYDSSTVDGLNITDLAKVPAIVLVGPKLPENRFYSRNEKPENDAVDGMAEVLRKPRTVDLQFDVIGITNSTKEFLSLLAVANEFMNRNIVLTMDRDPDDSTQGEVEYEFSFQGTAGFNTTTKGSTSNIRTFSGAIEIRGFDLDGLAGFNLEAVVERARTLVSAVDLDVTDMDG
jgi:hypothetical protein